MYSIDDVSSVCLVELFMSSIKKSNFNFWTYHLDIMNIHIKYMDMVVHNTIIGMMGFPLYFSLFAFLGSIMLNRPIKKYLGMMVIKVVIPR